MDDPISHAAAIAGRHRRELGFIPRLVLERAEQRSELYTGPHSMAYVWRRRDKQCTLHAICSEQPGQGSALLQYIISDCRARGQTSILARCPADTSANEFYRKRGFILERTEPGKVRALNVWRLAL